MKMNKRRIAGIVFAVVLTAVMALVLLKPQRLSDLSLLFSEAGILTSDSERRVSRMSASRNISTVQNLCFDADLFAICTVEEKLPAELTWMGDETGRIQLVTTDYRLRIVQTSDAEKGAVGDVVMLRMKGGETDDHAMYVTDSDPDCLTVGETYLFFFGSEYENILEDGTTDPDDVYRSAMSAEYTIFEPAADSAEMAAVNAHQTAISGQWRALAGPLTMDASDTVQLEDGSTVEIASMLLAES